MSLRNHSAILAWCGEVLGFWGWVWYDGVVKCRDVPDEVWCRGKFGIDVHRSWCGGKFYIVNGLFVAILMQYLCGVVGRAVLGKGSIQGNIGSQDL